MAQYYYLVAALPAISPDGKPTLGREDFLSFCKDILNPGDYDLIQGIRLEPPMKKSPNAVLESWYRREQGLRNSLVGLRAQALGIDRILYLKTDEGGEDYTLQGSVSETARAAFAAQSPEEAEKMLFKSRWSFLEELERDYFFALENVIVYYLKLLLSHKKSLMNPQAGLESYRSQYETIAQTFPLE